MSNELVFFPKDSVGDRFYIILEGEVGVYIRSEESIDGSGNQMFCVKTLK